MRTQTRLAAILAAVGALGCLVAWPAASSTRPASDLTSSETRAYVHLATDDAAVPTLESSFDRDAKQEQSHFVWRQSLQVGSLSEPEVTRLVQANRSEGLEFRLRPEVRDALLKQTASVEATLRELVPVYNQAVAVAKEQLIARGEVVRIATRPREADPEYPKLVRARAEIESTGQGAVWGFAGDGGGEVHILVRWTDWPDLDEIRRTQVSLVTERNRIVRRFIAQIFTEQGMEAFAR